MVVASLLNLNVLSGSLSFVKIAFGIEYDGSAYCGWQTQIGVSTVQACLEHALSCVANEPVKVFCAGRTDTGVHATGQVIHIETDVIRDDKSWIFGVNSNLPKDISVKWIKHVDDDFHGRFSAVRRTYHYYILNQPSRSALLNNKVVWERRPLVLQAMREAAGFLIGEHDFSAYRSLACQAHSPVRTVYRLELEQEQSLITVKIEANAFLHHMVRNIAGVLMTIGMDKYKPLWAREVLKSRDRTAGGVTAPPQGLYLMSVQYPERFELPQPERVIFF
jgi:tRNA pseudouridine38-40 synthase